MNDARAEDKNSAALATPLTSIMPIDLQDLIIGISNKCVQLIALPQTKREGSESPFDTPSQKSRYQQNFLFISVFIHITYTKIVVERIARSAWRPHTCIVETKEIFCDAVQWTRSKLTRRARRPAR